MEVPDLFIHPVTGNVVFLCPYKCGVSGGEVSSIEKGVQIVHSFS